MSVYAEFSFPVTAFPPGGRLRRNPDTTVEFERVVPVGSITHYLWFVGHDHERLLAEIESDPSVGGVDTLEAFPDRALVRIHWRDVESPLFDLVEAVAAVKGVESTDLPPLHTVVDPDALERLVSSLGRSIDGEGAGRAEFTLDGCRVVVRTSGEITVRRTEGGTTDEGAHDSVSTEAAFEAALARLVREADANGVGVEGGWACRDGSASPTWGIEIYEVDES